MKQFTQHYYSLTKHNYKTGEWYYHDPGGYVFADATFRTKIKPEDLPEWYVYERFYGGWGWMSAKGITDLVYRPSRFSNHFLKDDCLMISYGGKIEQIADDGCYLDNYKGWHERVWGAGVTAMIRAAAIYSGYDISELCKQLRDKVLYVKETWPDEFGNFTFDVDEYMAEPRERWYSYHA